METMAVDYRRTANGRFPDHAEIFEPTLREEFVTPEQSQLWVDASVDFDNRTLRLRVVDEYADQIIRGLWRMTGDPIRIDTRGQAIDGQHRLRAIIKANTGIRTIVMRNCPTDLVNYCDIGLPRRGPDFLRMAGSTANPNVASGALNWLWRYRNGKMHYSGLAMPRNELVAAYQQHIGLDESVSIAMTMRDICGRSSMIAGAHYLFTHLGGRDVADRFMFRLRDGEALLANEPEFQLRKRLIETHRGKRMNDIMASALTIKAWNAVREGRKIKHVKWQGREEFPVAV